MISKAERSNLEREKNYQSQRFQLDKKVRACGLNLQKEKKSKPEVQPLRRIKIRTILSMEFRPKEIKEVETTT